MPGHLSLPARGSRVGSGGIEAPRHVRRGGSAEKAGGSRSKCKEVASCLKATQFLESVLFSPLLYSVLELAKLYKQCFQSSTKPKGGLHGSYSCCHAEVAQGNFTELNVPSGSFPTCTRGWVVQRRVRGKHVFRSRRRISLGYINSSVAHPVSPESLSQNRRSQWTEIICPFASQWQKMRSALLLGCSAVLLLDQLPKHRARTGTRSHHHLERTRRSSLVNHLGRSEPASGWMPDTLLSCGGHRGHRLGRQRIKQNIS